MSRKKGEIVKLLLVILMVLGVVLGITLTLKPVPPDPTLSPEFLGDLLSSVSSDGGTALNSSSTPQNKAFNWLAVNNTSLGTHTNESIIQRYALATLYFSTNGDTWENKAHWMDDGNECDRWQDTSNDTKITCTDNGTLVELDLSSNGLQGTLPPEIGLLTSLEYLDLGFNILEGTMPTEIGQLKQLSFLLDLSNNTLTGTIPSEAINHLVSLDFLYLYNNMFMGNYTCPDFIYDCKISCGDNNNTDACRSLG